MLNDAPESQTGKDDRSLLEEFIRSHSDEAFSMLVSRYVDLVYSVAFRQVGDPHLAEEVTQAVFIILAHKAKSLGPKTILPGWLCRTARYTSANALTVRRRRQIREYQAHQLSQLTQEDHAEAGRWPEIAPLLDRAMGKLDKKEHDVLVLRFFEAREFKDIAVALGSTEAAAKMRVGRALDKLRKLFAREGVTSSSTAIAGALSAHSMIPAPLALFETTRLAGLGHGAAAGNTTFTLAKATLESIIRAQLKAAVVIGIAVILTAATAALVKVEYARYYGDESWEQDPHAGDFLRNLAAAKPQIAILPTIYPAARIGVQADDNQGHWIGLNIDDLTLISIAYNRSFPDDRIVFLGKVPAQRYDFIANLASDSTRALREKIEIQLGLSAYTNTMMVDSLILTSIGPQALRPPASRYKSPRSMPFGKFGNSILDPEPYPPLPAMRILKGATCADLAGSVESWLNQPVIDRTGLNGKYDFVFRILSNWGLPEWKGALNKYGLDLVPSREAVSMLVVDTGSPDKEITHFIPYQAVPPVYHLLNDQTTSVPPAAK